MEATMRLLESAMHDGQRLMEEQARTIGYLQERNAELQISARNLSALSVEIQGKDATIADLRDQLKAQETRIAELEQRPMPTAPLPDVTRQALAVICRAERIVEMEELRQTVVEQREVIKKLSKGDQIMMRDVWAGFGQTFTITRKAKRKKDTRTLYEFLKMLAIDFEYDEEESGLGVLESAEFVPRIRHRGSPMED
jgi:predicted RNase H-like nuclease (RuvC/YqgF family)